MGAFVPAGFRKLDEYAKEIGPAKVGSLLAAGTLEAVRMNPWGDLFPIPAGEFRGQRASDILQFGKINGRLAGRYSPQHGDDVLVRLPNQPQRPTAVVARLPNRDAKRSRPHRPKETGFDKTDAPLVEAMRVLIEQGLKPSPTKAAESLVDRAQGGGTTDSKVRRLVDRYKKAFGE